MLYMNYSYLNTGTSIPVRTGYNILIHAAISGFTANGVNVPTTITNPLYLNSSPLMVTGAVTNIAAGTIFYSYNVNNSETI